MKNIENNNKLLSPTNDVVFQCLFGKPRSESFTRDFISKILQKEISELDLTENPKLIPEYPNEKYGVVDVKAKEKTTGILYDVEMQMTTTEKLTNRMLYYWSRIYAEQLERGGKYKDLKPVVLIMILKGNLKLTKEIKESHTEWKIIENKGRKIVLTDNFEMHIIEMKKYAKKIKQKEKDELKEWIEFLEHPERGKGMGENKEIEKAREELERISADKQIRRMAQLREKWELDERSREGELEDAQEELKNARKEIEETKKELKEMQKEKEKVQKEKEEAQKEKEEAQKEKEEAQKEKEKAQKEIEIDIAQKMKTKDIPIDEIIEITGLTKEEIENL